MKNKCYIRNYLMCLDLYHIYNTVNKHPDIYLASNMPLTHVQSCEKLFSLYVNDELI